LPKATDKEAKPADGVDQRVEIAGGDIDVKEESGFYEAYRDFARNLRTWFIAYGIGGPVLFASADDIWVALKDSGSGQIVIYSFLGGVALQIVAALMYKSAMWYIYIGELKPSFRKTIRHKISDWLSEMYFVEASLDILTLLLFGVATTLALRVLVV